MLPPLEVVPIVLLLSASLVMRLFASARTFKMPVQLFSKVVLFRARPFGIPLWMRALFGPFFCLVQISEV